MDLETQMEADCLLDPATEAVFMGNSCSLFSLFIINVRSFTTIFIEIWLNFLLVLSAAWIFRRDVYLSLGVDIEKGLGDYILGGGQPPDVACEQPFYSDISFLDMASCFQQQFNRTCENPRYVEVMGNMEQAIQTHLVRETSPASDQLAVGSSFKSPATTS